MMNIRTGFILILFLLYSTQKSDAQISDSLKNDSVNNEEILIDNWPMPPLPTLTNGPANDSGKVNSDINSLSWYDVMPEFPGGQDALAKFLQHNLKYPKSALDARISGTVLVTFIVEPDGSVSNVTLARGIGGDCDQEAIRAVQSMPKWKPGTLKGQPVRVQLCLPVTFKGPPPEVNKDTE